VRQICIRIRRILHIKSASDGCGYWLTPSHPTCTTTCITRLKLWLYVWKFQTKPSSLVGTVDVADVKKPKLAEIRPSPAATATYVPVRPGALKLDVTSKEALKKRIDIQKQKRSLMLRQVQEQKVVVSSQFDSYAILLLLSVSVSDSAVLQWQKIKLSYKLPSLNYRNCSSASVDRRCGFPRHPTWMAL